MLILKNPNSPDYETRYLIDTARHVILSIESRLKNKVYGSTKFDDFVEIAGLAHWLKGAGGTVGYDAFTEPAMKLEQAAKDGSTAETAAMLAEVRSLAARLVAPDDVPAPRVPDGGCRARPGSC